MEITPLLATRGITCFGIVFLVWMSLRIRAHRALGRVSKQIEAQIARYSVKFGSRRDAAAFLTAIGATKTAPDSPFQLSRTVKIDLINRDYASAAVAYFVGICLAPLKQAIGRSAKQWYEQKRDQLFPEAEKAEEQSSLETQIREATSQYRSQIHTCDKRDGYLTMFTLLGLAAIGVVIFGPSLSSREFSPTQGANPATASSHVSTNSLYFQKAAIAQYPELGVAGSPFNKRFIARYNFYKQAKPEYFGASDWPIKLAGEIAQEKPQH